MKQGGRGGEGGERKEREAVGVLMGCWLQTLCAYKSEMLMAQYLPMTYTHLSAFFGPSLNDS